MFDDYVLYLLESLHCQERANDLMRAMKGEASAGEAKVTFDVTLDSRWDTDACPLRTRSAEREEEFPLTETTPASQSPESYSPARSVHSVGVSSASSPTEAVSPEYPGGASTTGDSHRDVLNKQMSPCTSVLCANTILSCP